jgi:hypothetical protein
MQYELADPIHYVQNHLSKAKWKSLITSAIYRYWSDRINEEIKYYSTLKYLSPTYEIDAVSSAWLHSLQVGSIGF